jgi:hypothetical protein
MKHLVVLLAALVGTGCPGQRRPPPWATEALRKQAEEDARRAEIERLKRPESAPSGALTSLSLAQRSEAFAQRVTTLAGTVKAGERAALLVTCDALQDAGGELLEAAVEAEDEDAEDAIMTALEELGVVRIQVVELPK